MIVGNKLLQLVGLGMGRREKVLVSAKVIGYLYT